MTMLSRCRKHSGLISVLGKLLLFFGAVLTLTTVQNSDSIKSSTTSAIATFNLHRKLNAIRSDVGSVERELLLNSQPVEPRERALRKIQITQLDAARLHRAIAFTEEAHALSQGIKSESNASHDLEVIRSDLGKTDREYAQRCSTANKATKDDALEKLEQISTDFSEYVANTVIPTADRIDPEIDKVFEALVKESDQHLLAAKHRSASARQFGLCLFIVGSFLAIAAEFLKETKATPIVSCDNLSAIDKSPPDVNPAEQSGGVAGVVAKRSPQPNVSRGHS